MFNSSDDGISWGASTEVYRPNGTNDALPKVRKHNGTYHMWVGSTAGSGVNYATSADGLSWSSIANVPRLSNAYTVLVDDGGFEAWFGGGTVGYHYGTSSNGAIWIDHGLAMPLGEFDFEPSSGNLDVIKVNGRYHMWYSSPKDGGGHHLAYASSPDGQDWQKHGLVGGLDDVRDVSSPSVLLDDGHLKLWFFVDGGGNQAFFADGGAIPEPATMAIFVMSLVTISLKRRRC